MVGVLRAFTNIGHTFLTAGPPFDVLEIDPDRCLLQAGNLSMARTYQAAVDLNLHSYALKFHLREQLIDVVIKMQFLTSLS
jgi:hypothetical protein